MKKLIFGTGIALALAVTPAFAHCGKCGSGESHDHGAAKTAKNIVGTAEAAGSFSTLIAAVKAAGLEDTLASGGPYTVFAPTDAAFAKLPVGTVDKLIANPEQLREILLYHVVPGAVTSDQVVKLDRATTAQGGDLTIAVHEGSVMVNNATVTQADVTTSNGVIHVIDTVMLPSS